MGGRRKGRTSGHHLKEQGAGREQVRAAVDNRPIELLRSHVGRGTHDLALHRQIGDRGRGVVHHRLGQAKIEQFDPVRRDENVRRLEIPVHDAARMQRLERWEQQRKRVDRRLGAILLEHLGQRLSLEQLHDEKHLIRVFRNLVDLADTRMIHGGRGPGLTPDPLLGGRTDIADGLDRHCAVQLLVEGGVDDAHPALT